MRNLCDRNNAKGFTLVEVVLAISLGSLILSSMAIAMQVMSFGWRKGDAETELMSHAQLAMDRMMTELRYAEILNMAQGSNLNFTVSNLDSDSQTETVDYSLSSGMLNRSFVDTGTALLAIIAGSTTAGINVTSFRVTPLNVVGGVMNPLSAAQLAQALAVQIDLTVADAHGESFSLSSMVKMRNL